MRYSGIRSTALSASLAVPFLLLLAAAGGARAQTEPSPWSWEAGARCLAPESRNLARGAAEEAVTAICGRRGLCDDPSVRDATSTLAINLRAVAHVFRPTSGSCALSESQVRATIAEVNADLRASGAGIQIDLDGVRTHVDDTIAQLPDCDQDGCLSARRLIYLAREMYAEAPEAQLNFYFSCQDHSGFGGLAGASSFPWFSSPPDASMGVWLNSEAITTGTAHLATHEVGHALGLLHTHRGVSEVTGCSAGCAEHVGAADNDTRGDFAADTPPTPENTSCRQPGNRDCFGTPYGTTQPENYMGYGPPSCINRFTTQQLKRMQCWTQTNLVPWYSTPAAGCGRAADASTVALWRFEEAGGTTLASSAGGADGTLLGSASRSRSHCGSPALAFTVGADGARLPVSDLSLPRGSVSCSFRWTGGPGWIFDRERTSVAADLGARIDAGGIVRFHVAGAERVASSRAVEEDRWYRLTCSWDGAGARITLDDIAAGSASTTAIPSAGGGALIAGSGGFSAPGADGFTGEIDEMTVSRSVSNAGDLPAIDRSPKIRLSAIPTPFRSGTSVAFVLPSAARARLIVCDLLGRRLATLVDETLPAGPQTFEWNGRRASGERVPPGIYVMHLSAGGATARLTVARVP